MANQKDKSLQKLEQRLLHRHMTWGNFWYSDLPTSRCASYTGDDFGQLLV